MNLIVRTMSFVAFQDEWKVFSMHSLRAIFITVWVGVLCMLSGCGGRQGGHIVEVSRVEEAVKIVWRENVQVDPGVRYFRALDYCEIFIPEDIVSNQALVRAESCRVGKTDGHGDFIAYNHVLRGWMYIDKDTIDIHLYVENSDTLNRYSLGRFPMELNGLYVIR